MGGESGDVGSTNLEFRDHQNEEDKGRDQFRKAGAAEQVVRKTVM